MIEVETDNGVFQVVMIEEINIRFQDWLQSLGLGLFCIPLGSEADDLPTYGIGIADTTEEDWDNDGGAFHE